MSFTNEIKQEIAYNKLKDCCCKAQLSALLQLTSSISIIDRKINILVKTENPTTAKRIVSLAKQLYDVQTELTVTKKTNLRKNNVYRVRISDENRRILTDLSLYSETRGLLSHPTYDVVSKDHCARAYIAGAFVAYGSCNSPNNSNYHLEIGVNDEDYASFIVKLMNRFNFDARITQRRAKYIVYLKRADSIADFLKLIGAHESCMNFENVRIDRDFINSQRRVENCLIANEVKKLRAADEQMMMINKIKEHGLTDKLDEKLKMVYDLRIKYPDASLIELCDYYEKRYGQTISKSGIKHRLNKIENIALLID